MRAGKSEPVSGRWMNRPIIWLGF